MLTRRRICGLAALLGIVLIAILGYLAFVPRFSAEEFKARVESALPKGTPRSDVEAWLSSQDISFGDTKRMDEDRPSGLAGEVSQYRINLFFVPVVRFEIHFDKTDRVTTILAHGFVYGP
jgi:hypothetical protein